MSAMSKKLDSLSAHLEEAAQSTLPFPVDKEYSRCRTALTRARILTPLPIFGSVGVIGVDGNEYPFPTHEQVVDIFDCNRELVRRKVPQGFDRLELTPLAMPIPVLVERMRAALLKHSAEGEIYQTRTSHSDPLIPVRINTEKHVWIWDTLRGVLDTNELVYFPREYSSDHHGLTKIEAINDAAICAVQGWSVGLVESLAIVPQQGRGKTLGGRKQIEVGSSPRDYLQVLQSQDYHGETGKTLEDFIIRFLTHLEETKEVSNDRYDDNSLWCLGQYVKYVEKIRSDLVPTGWWHRLIGRARLDAHRPGNRLATRSWGSSTTVRLLKP
jgi:hypothetical protein